VYGAGVAILIGTEGHERTLGLASRARDSAERFTARRLDATRAAALSMPLDTRNRRDVGKFQSKQGKHADGGALLTSCCESPST
jgi:hypothetical protein